MSPRIRRAVMPIAGSALLALCGCAEWNAGWSAANGYVGTQITAQQGIVQGVNDNAAKAWADAGCAISYGELVRNGSGNLNLVQAIIELCGQPSGYVIVHAGATQVIVTTPPAPAPAAK